MDDKIYRGPGHPVGAHFHSGPKGERGLPGVSPKVDMAYNEDDGTVVFTVSDGYGQREQTVPMAELMDDWMEHDSYEVLKQWMDTHSDAEWWVDENNGLHLSNVPPDADDRIVDAVDDWLDDHPEATTTVQDGSITVSKLHEDVWDRVEYNSNYTREEMVREQFRVIASYFADLVNTTSVVGTPTRDKPFACLYNDTGKTYTRLVGVGGTDDFTYTDTTTVDGVSYPVVYLNCAAFVSLITRCRDWAHNPNRYAIDNNTGDRFVLLPYTLESGNWREKPYTYDWFNVVACQRNARMQDGGANKLRPLYHKDGATFIHDAKGIHSGDIIFTGNTSQGYYNGIDHVAYFVSADDVALLNEIASTNYGFTFKTYNEESSDVGYVFDCSSYNGGDTNNYIKFSALEDWYSNRGSEDVGFYVNGTNQQYLSNKYNRIFTNETRTYNEAFFGGRYQGDNELTQAYSFDFSQAVGMVVSMGESGVALSSSGVDCNNLENGLYRFTTTATNNSTNKPPNCTEPFTLLVLGRQVNDGPSGIQIAISNTTTRAIWYREKGINDDNTWGTWWRFSGTIFIPTNSKLSDYKIGNFAISTAVLPTITDLPTGFSTSAQAFLNNTPMSTSDTYILQTLTSYNGTQAYRVLGTSAGGGTWRYITTTTA